MVERLGGNRRCEGCDRRTRWESMASLELVFGDEEHPIFSGPWCHRCCEEVAAWYRNLHPQARIYYRAA
jgi:hypothetical protein